MKAAWKFSKSFEEFPALRPPFSAGKDTQLSWRSTPFKENSPYLVKTNGTQLLMFSSFYTVSLRARSHCSALCTNFKLAPWFVMADEEEENWPEFFETNRLIPVHPNRRKSGSQTKPNVPFCLLFKSVIGISLPPASVSLLSWD